MKVFINQYCTECLQCGVDVIEIAQEVSYEAEAVRLCITCLEKALAEMKSRQTVNKMALTQLDKP